MLVLAIVLVIILAALIYVLFAPFYFEIDSERGILRVRFHTIAAAQLLMDDGLPVVRARIGRWHKQIRIRGRQAQPKPVKVTKPAMHDAISFRKIKAVLQSFKVNRFRVTVDTGSEPWNALLFPAVWVLRRQSGADISMNFWQDEGVVVELENNVARIAWAYITG